MDAVDDRNSVKTPRFTATMAPEATLQKPKQDNAEPMMEHKLSFAIEKKLTPPVLDLDQAYAEQENDASATTKGAMPIQTTSSTAVSPLVISLVDQHEAKGEIQSSLLGNLKKDMSDTEKSMFP